MPSTQLPGVIGWAVAGGGWRLNTDDDNRLVHRAMTRGGALLTACHRAGQGETSPGFDTSVACLKSIAGPRDRHPTHDLRIPRSAIVKLSRARDTSVDPPIPWKVAASSVADPLFQGK